jgi:plasma kallikrein
MMICRTLLVVFLNLNLICGSPQRTDTLDDRIRNVFNTDTRGTFDMIVEPEPENLAPTAQPTFLQNNGQSCKCVPYYQCNNNRISTDNRIYGEIDVRYNPETCQDVLDVCCAQENELPANALTQTPPPIANPTNQGTKQCGVRNVGGIDFKVVGKGNEAGFAEFPWMVALLSPHKECLCGGSLIHESIVLTGAHCIFNVSQTTLIVR